MALLASNGVYLHMTAKTLLCIILIDLPIFPNRIKMAGLLTCSQCKGDFKDPRALPCLHIFCHLCLVELADCAYEEDAVTCPICQKYHRLPDKGVLGFRQNLPIKSFLKMFGQNEQRSPKTTMCKQHPDHEADLLCQEYDCNGAVLCRECVNENHRNHQIFPAKEVCTRKLSRLKMYRQALKQNNETLVMLKKKLERNKKEIKNEVSRRFGNYYAILEHVAEQVEGDIDKQTYYQELRLLEQEDQLREAQSLLESLEFRLSCPISIILQANAERRLDPDIDKLHRLLEGWQFKYAMPVVPVEDSKLSIPTVSAFGKIKLREGVLKGSSVGSIEPRSLALPVMKTQHLPLELPIVRTRRPPGQMAPICPRRIPEKKTSKTIPKTVMAKNPVFPGKTTGNGTTTEVTPELPTAEFEEMGTVTPTKSVRELPSTGNHDHEEAATPTDLTPKSPELPLGAGDYDRAMASTEWTSAAAAVEVESREWSITAAIKNSSS